VKYPRSSGVLLHPTSFPGPYGIGDLGDEAFKFVDFLAASNQTLWQILPLGPTGYGDSPYQSFSAFAGNILLISPQRLLEAKLISKESLSNLPTPPEGRADFQTALQIKVQLLQEAFRTFREAKDPELHINFESFSKQEASWLDDYALFQAIRATQGNRAWNEWDRPLALRNKEALDAARVSLRDEIEAQKFYQYLFFHQWTNLKAYCNERNIKIVGDIPIFVAYDSADVWTNPQEFKLNEEGVPLVVAGVPPDYFSETGQLWGNPIYNWERMQENNFEWWIRRFQAILKTVDIVRIDHFRGFAACWEIPFGDRTAVNGRWVNTPGKELFARLDEVFGDLPIIAEDLGVITPEVEELRDSYEFPGMRVLQFGFTGGSQNVHMLYNYVANSVAYTGTHDNNTTVGWFNENKRAGRPTPDLDIERAFCLKYLHTDGEKIHWDLIRAVFASVSNMAIVPLQDLLGLDTDARMNFPSTTSGNWAWRYLPDALTKEVSETLKDMTTTYGRVVETEKRDDSIKESK
jgi:4-alpha-glucanotransferase